jgi:hypothetical protein
MPEETDESGEAGERQEGERREPGESELEEFRREIAEKYQEAQPD